MHGMVASLTSFIMRQIATAKISCWICQICYHFVIIVIDNIFYNDMQCWCLFLSFFWRQKLTFHPHQKHETIMLLELHDYYMN
jgi:hypothetical protein